MFGKFMPTGGRFFELFNAHARCIVVASNELVLLIDNPHDAEIHKHNVLNAEKAGDKLTRETMDLLHRTFITPFGRDVIHKLSTTIDDVLDLIQDVASTISLYDVQSLSSEGRQLAHICTVTSERVQFAVSLLADTKQSTKILTTCQEIDRLESDADRVLRAAMSALFREESNVKTLIKLKEIYELLESIVDRCEDVANIIEGIVLESA